MSTYRAVLAASLLTVATAASVLTGCTPRVASAAELDQLGTRSYARSVADVRGAVVTALKLQGYEVVTTTPRIRTAPKPIAVHAIGGGGRAVGFEETMAWDVDVTGTPSGASVHAQLRGQIGDSPMKGVFYDYADNAFRDLFTKVEESLGAGRTRAGANH